MQKFYTIKTNNFLHKTLISSKTHLALLNVTTPKERLRSKDEVEQYNQEGNNTVTEYDKVFVGGFRVRS